MEIPYIQNISVQLLRTNDIAIAITFICETEKDANDLYLMLGGHSIRYYLKNGVIENFVLMIDGSIYELPAREILLNKENAIRTIEQATILTSAHRLKDGRLKHSPEIPLKRLILPSSDREV